MSSHTIIHINYYANSDLSELYVELQIDMASVLTVPNGEFF